MMFAPGEFIRRPYPVRAVRVSERNITRVAAWCGGVVREDEKLRIDMRTIVPRPPRAYAFVGDWVLLSDKGLFKAYTDRSFRLSFIPRQRTR